MARILIGWELGAYTGHARRILRIADAVAADGHEPVLALQRMDALAALGRTDYPLWQAPVWPRLLGSMASAFAGPPAGHADILARVGLDMPGALGGMVEAWERIVAAARPDLVIAEYAPALLCAARGRVATIATGTGFDLPASRMARFPSLSGGPPIADEAALLDRANAELATQGRPALAALPALFAADADLVCAFAEFDPYAQWRAAPRAPPEVALPIPLATADRGDELFVYWPGRFAIADKLWSALRLSGFPVRVHAPLATAAERARLADERLVFEPEPLPFAQIVERSALLLSHGGSGVVSSAVVAGLPQVVVPIDLEKGVQARGVVQLGVGGFSAPTLIQPERFAADLRRLAADRAIAERAHAVALDKRTQLEPGLMEMTRTMAADVLAR